MAVESKNFEQIQHSLREAILEAQRDKERRDSLAGGNIPQAFRDIDIRLVELKHKFLELAERVARLESPKSQ